MRSKHVLTLADVKKMLAACEAEAVRNKWAVAISIVDDGGFLLGFARMDGAPAISAEVSSALAGIDPRATPTKAPTANEASSLVRNFAYIAYFPSTQDRIKDTYPAGMTVLQHHIRRCGPEARPCEDGGGDVETRSSGRATIAGLTREKPRHCHPLATLRQNPLRPLRTAPWRYRRGRMPGPIGVARSRRSRVAEITAVMW